MRVAAAFCAISLVLGVALVPAEPPPRADVRILEYDKDGRPTIVRRFNAENGEKAPGADVLVLPENRYEDGELLVVNPPPRFQGPARRLGFTVIETVQLPQLSLEVFRLRTPEGLSVPQAITLLRRRFPGSVIDANHIYQPQQGGEFHRQRRARAHWLGQGDGRLRQGGAAGHDRRPRRRAAPGAGRSAHPLPLLP